jgi:hypothetical protein
MTCRDPSCGHQPWTASIIHHGNPVAGCLGAATGDPSPLSFVILLGWGANAPSDYVFHPLASKPFAVARNFFGTGVWVECQGLHREVRLGG